MTITKGTTKTTLIGRTKVIAITIMLIETNGNNKNNNDTNTKSDNHKNNNYNNNLGWTIKE